MICKKKTKKNMAKSYFVVESYLSEILTEKAEEQYALIPILALIPLKITL